MHLNQTVGNESVGRLRLCNARCGNVSLWMYMYSYVLHKTKTCRHHLRTRICITHLSFHYSSWKDFVIGFFPKQTKQFCTPLLPEMRFILLNYILKQPILHFALHQICAAVNNRMSLAISVANGVSIRLPNGRICSSKINDQSCLSKYFP